MDFRLGSRTPLSGRTCLNCLFIIFACFSAALFISCGGSSSHPTHNAYISLTSADSVGLFHITNSSGVLSSVSNSVPQTKTGPVGLALHSSGKFLFAANSTGNSVSTFSVATDGSLTQAGNATQAGVGPHAAVIDPSGQFLLVTNTTSNSISVFSIDSGSGALTPASTFTNIPGPTEILVTSSNFVYVLTPSTNNTVNGFSFSGGALSPISGSPFQAGHGTSGIAVDSSEKFLYTANTTDNTISGFTIGAGGALAPILGSPYSSTAGSAPGALAVDTSGKFLYVATPGSTNSIWVFSITPGSGILTPISGSPFSLTAGTLFMLMEPRGQFFYVGNQAGNNVAAYSYDSTGTPKAITGSPFSTGTAPGKMIITH